MLKWLTTTWGLFIVGILSDNIILTNGETNSWMPKTRHRPLYRHTPSPLTGGAQHGLSQVHDSKWGMPNISHKSTVRSQKAYIKYIMYTKVFMHSSSLQCINSYLVYLSCTQKNYQMKRLHLALDITLILSNSHIQKYKCSLVKIENIQIKICPQTKKYSIFLHCSCVGKSTGWRLYIFLALKNQD